MTDDNFQNTLSKLPQVITSCFLILLFSVFIISCKGQDKNDERTIRSIDSSAISQDASVQGSPIYVDPLFYIDGQLCQHLRRIFQDSNGHLWFGTNVYGLMRYDGDTLEYFSENEGFDGGRITEIVEDKNGHVWFGKYGGITKYDGETFTDFTEKDGLINNDVFSLTIDRNGIFWIGTLEGVSRFDGEVFTDFPIPKIHVKDTTSSLSYNRFTTIMEDSQGTLWFGTDGFGICKYDARQPDGVGQGKSFSHITIEDGLSDNNVADILEDKNGNIWISTMFGGISMYDGTTFTNFTENGVVDGIEVWSIYEDRSGNIWFPAENVGVYRYDTRLPYGQGKSFTNFSEKDGLNTNGIQSIFEDKEGRFWFGGWGGLFRYDPLIEQANRKPIFSVTKDGPWK